MPAHCWGWRSLLSSLDWSLSPVVSRARRAAPHRRPRRVYNNSTIRGLAARAAGDLTAQGWTVTDVGNYPCGTIPTATVYYQEGTDQRADAETIGAELGMRVMPRFPGIAHASPGLIVIVTKDYRR